MTFTLTASAAHDHDSQVLLLLGAKRGAKRQTHIQPRSI